MDKIQLIKQEIEILKGKVVDDCSSYSNGWKHSLRLLEIFIDSLPEEPSVKDVTWEDVNTLESLIYQVHNEYPSIGEKSFGLEVLERFQDCQDDIEEPVNEDLEEEIERCWEGWIDPNPEVKGVDGYLSKDEFSTYARHFAEWQKQQMLKDSVECTCHESEEGGINLFGVEILSDGLVLDNEKYKVGDRVKVFVIKEN